jgi:hypothetical protein
VSYATTIQSQSQTIKLDKRQRRRHQRSGKQVVVLVALGFWNDGTGRREVLDWEIATSRRAYGMGNVAQPFMATGPATGERIADGGA